MRNGRAGNRTPMELQAIKNTHLLRTQVAADAGDPVAQALLRPTPTENPMHEPVPCSFCGAPTFRRVMFERPDRIACKKHRKPESERTQVERIFG